MPETSSSRTRVFLRFRDMDELGHLSHSVYHDLFGEGRLALITECLTDSPIDVVLVRTEVDYRHEVRRGSDYVDVVSRIEAIGRRSLTISQIMLLPDGTTTAEAKSVLAVWDPEQRRSRELSAPERTALSRLS